MQLYKGENKAARGGPTEYKISKCLHILYIAEEQIKCVKV